MTLPTNPKERKDIPLAAVLDYFPDALSEVAKVIKAGNQQHNPGQPIHWARGKSSDHDSCLLRHFLERGTLDTDGLTHSAKVAWRALALLQLELEQAHGLPISRGSRAPVEPSAKTLQLLSEGHEDALAGRVAPLQLELPGTTYPYPPKSR